MIGRAVIAAIAAGAAACAPSATLPAGHPARPDAPIGRLAGAPTALQRGVATEHATDVPHEPPPSHLHHH